MSRAVVLRLADAFFRRWVLYLGLLLASVALGVVFTMRTPARYEAKGAIAVESRSLVSAQSGIEVSGNYTYLTPAQFTTQELGGLIATDVFLESVLDRAGVQLSNDLGARETELFSYRLTMAFWPASGNIVQIAVTTDDPQLSADLATSLIDQFLEYKAGADLAESGASVEFFSNLVETYRADLDDARAAVDRSLSGVAVGEELSPQQELALQRLQATESQAEERFLGAQDNLEVARLAALQTSTDIEQSYTVLDAPAVPGRPLGRLLNRAIDLSMFVAVGLLTALVGPLAAALMNQQVRFPDDLELGGELSVVAVVPSVPRRKLRLTSGDRSVQAGDEAVLNAVPSAEAAPHTTTVERLAATTVQLDGDQPLAGPNGLADDGVVGAARAAFERGR